MWLRNWDNIQVIKITGAVETTATSEFGDNSIALKSCEGEVFTGYTPMFCGLVTDYQAYQDINIHNTKYDSYNGRYNSGMITNLNLNGCWSEAVNYADFSTRFTRFDSKDNANSESYRQYNAATTGIVLLVGSGQTAETYNDYCLETEISNLSHVSYGITSLKKDNTEKKWYGYVTRTFKNDTSENIQVSEIVIYIMLQSAYSSSYKSQKPVCVYRQVIDPVTIAPTEIQTFSIRIELPANG